MKGTVKFFDKKKGWGFITGDEGTDYFVHCSSLALNPKCQILDEDDIVEFDTKERKRGWQAVNVRPILTRQMVKKVLQKDNLFLKPFRNALGLNRYLVVDINNVLQTCEQCMTLSETAAYAGIDVEGLKQEGVYYGNFRVNGRIKQTQ